MPRKSGLFLSGKARIDKEWSNSMAATVLPRLIILPGVKIKLTTPERSLLQKLFSDYEYLVIDQEFTGGFSATRVFKVTPWRERRELAAQIVKLGPQSYVDDEKQRHDRYVKDALPLLAAQITNFETQGQLGAIAYTYIGGNFLGQTLSLKEYCLQNASDQILATLKPLLVRALGSGWYGQHHPGRGPLFFEQFYSPYFLPDLTLELRPQSADTISQTALPLDPAYHHLQAEALAWEYREIVRGEALQLEGFHVIRQTTKWLDLARPDDMVRIRVNLEPDYLQLPIGQPLWLRAQVTGRRWDDTADIVAAIFANSTEVKVNPAAETVTLGGETYLNPLSLCQSYLERRMPRNLSIIHGDLHLFNVIVDGDDRSWLIDFGRVGEGHAIFDFIEFETHFRHAILGELPLSPADLADFERRLICTTLEPESRPPSTHPRLTEAFAVLRGVRTFAADYLARRDDFQGEYFPALYLYTLATLKYYRENGMRSARHAFITAMVLATYLNGQLDCAPALSPSTPALTVKDPTLYLHAYYLKKSADDSPEQLVARQQLFITELKRAAAALRQWLGLSAEPVIWNDELPAGSRTMVLRYNSGPDPWQDPSGQILAWLIAHEMNDTYLLRLILTRPGQNQSPGAFAGLCEQLPWQPDTNRPEWLGQSLFYAGLSSAPSSELAQAIFGTAALLHTPLACGELYGRHSLESPFLLIFTSSQQETLANDYFGQLALELGWYTHKALRQAEEYENYLYPAIERVKQKVLATLDGTQMFYDYLGRGDKAFETLAAFHRQIRALELAVLEYDKLLVTAEEIVEAGISTNVGNYAQVTEPGKFLTNPRQDEIFVTQRQRLEQLPQALKADLSSWKRRLEQARRSLATFQTIAHRFPLLDRNLQDMAASVQAYFQTNRSLVQPFEVELTTLFDDIKDSTAYVAEHGDRQWQQLMQQHNNLLHPIIARHQGQVVKNLGDGSLAIFADAALAVHAALDIQQELQHHNRAISSENQLHVRIGLHTGRALLSDTDVLGLAVSLATRVCSEADAGEVVISEDTYRQAGEVAAGFEALGARELKGVEGEVGLYRRVVQG